MYYLLRNINPYYTQLVCSASFGPVTTYWLSVVADFSSISKIWDVTILDSRPGLCVCEDTLGTPAGDRQPFCRKTHRLSASQGFLHSCLAPRLTLQRTPGLFLSLHKVDSDHSAISTNSPIHNWKLWRTTAQPWCQGDGGLSDCDS